MIENKNVILLMLCFRNFKIFSVLENGFSFLLSFCLQKGTPMNIFLIIYLEEI